MPRRTRIVATLGPATDNPETLRAILAAGVDVARVNFSHGKAEEHLARIAALRAAAAELKRNVAVLADLPGPKLRVYLSNPRDLVYGQAVSFSMTHEATSPDDLLITEPEMLHEVKAGQRVLLDDGRLQLEVVSLDKARVTTRVTVGGLLQNKKGVNLPDTPLTVPAMTPQDREALVVAAEGGVDWLALSFVRTAEAVNKEAILNELDAARGVAGITIVTGVEDFAITPFEARAEVAA